METKSSNRRDFAGNWITVGDAVVYGADNGSTIMTGEVFKITHKFVWINNDDKPVVHKRWPERVHVLK